MTKWSDFILNLGTSGPQTLQGIKNLGFALVSEIPSLAKYLRVDAAQAFTNPEKSQGRDNLGLGTMATQAASDVVITGGSITGITDLALADGGTGASTAPDARTNLGLGNVDNTSDANKPVSTAQQAALDLKANLASPALTGNPTTPTPAIGDNDTSIASTAFVKAEITNQQNTNGVLLAAAVGLGYSEGTGAGGSVTQATNKLTGVTINKPTGRIITSNSALGSGVTITFLVTNSFCDANDTISWNVSAGSTGFDSYCIWIRPENGSFTVLIYNRTGGTLSDALSINFCIHKGSVN